MRRILISLLIVLVAVAVAGGYWWKRSQPKTAGMAYASKDRLTLWSSTAQVREPVATLHYGEPVAVLGIFGDHVQVRTGAGVVGWVDADRLILPDLWQRLEALAARSRPMPVQARGHTRVVSNLHIEPGREAPVIGQLGKNTPVEILGRAVARREPAEGKETHSEDWLLVRTPLPPVGELAGWALGRFIELDLPEPLRDYASASAMRVVGWYGLAQVTDPTAGVKPYYLVVATRGREGQPCDFTMIRVYTWGFRRKQYETAYVEDNLCGMLPVEVAAQPNGDYLFWFTELTETGKQVETYQMRQTIVRPEQKREGLRGLKRRRAAERRGVSSGHLVSSRR
jgi:hypothetical protein